MSGAINTILFSSLLLSTFVFAQHPLDPAAGKALFERNWVAAPASTSASDGLGPYFNARSCAACHPGAGRGNSLQALVLRAQSERYGQQLQPYALPGLLPELSFQVQFTSSLLPSGTPGRVVSVLSNNDAQLPEALSARFAPSLTGMSVLAEISDESLISIADPDDENEDGISGRLSWLRDPITGQARIGRFGWKAEHADLDTQIAAAFSLDIGLGSPHFPSPYGDCTPSQKACLAGVSGAETGEAETEIDGNIIELIREYLLSLPVLNESIAGLEGEKLFSELGCIACHIPRIGPDQSGLIYSDLLLHDMGQGLSAGFSALYAADSEWRTPPLKDIKDSKYLLHDGRALSINDAILWHAGEANSSRKAYLELNGLQKALLLAFLNTL